jgi:hypothetical protein
MAFRQFLEKKPPAAPFTPVAENIKKKRYSDLVEALISESKGKTTTADYSAAYGFHAKSDDELIVSHKVLGQKLDWKLYARVYNNVGIVKNAINNTANFAIQSGYELEGEDGAVNRVKEWIDKHNFDLYMLNILKQGLIYGNSYLEFTTEDDFKLLPVEQMYVVVSKGGAKDGQVKGYIQLSNNDFSSDPPRWDADGIIHFKWNELGTSFYGIPDIRSALPTIRYLLQYLEDVGEIIHRYGHPIVHWVVGSEDVQATSTQLTNLKAKLDDLKVGQDLITSFGVEGKVLSANMDMIQLDGLIKQLENQLIGALEVPSFFIRGGESSNKATSQSELQAFDRRVKALRSALGQVIEDKIFKEKLGADVKFAWRELSTEGELNKSEIVERLNKGGVPTPVAMKMAGWNSYVDDFEEEIEKDIERQKKLQPEPAFGQKPPQKAPVPKTKPKEEDFPTQADFIEALEAWKEESIKKG